MRSDRPPPADGLVVRITALGTGADAITPLAEATRELTPHEWEQVVRAEDTCSLP